MSKWFIAAKKADFEQWGKQFGIDPVIARIIRNRDITEEHSVESFLRGSLSDCYAPLLMKDMEKGCTLLLERTKAGKKIRIIGDYDIDGICASYILKRGLRFFGADAEIAIPHRMKDGYGISQGMVEEAFENGVDTILTCDNGIAAWEQISYAKEKGMTVIITDHHEIPYELKGADKVYRIPPADAVINPKQQDCSYPFPAVCGGMVAYKMVQALLTVSKMQGEELLEELLPFAAFATVGDVMELADENRIVVKYGLQAMVHTKNTGLKALIEVNGLEGKLLTPYHIGFVLGPCLNATGRLDTAVKAIELLEAENRADAVRIAGNLKAMNESRKEMTAKGVEEALKLVEAPARKEDKVLVIFLPDCHESLAGIIAGRVREKYGRPVFVLTRGEEYVKGSGRSIEAFDMYEEMSRCKDLFLRFGGHKMAAGLSIREADIEEFRRRINAGAVLTEEDFVEKLLIDVPMPVSYITKELIAQLSVLEPFGNGNPKPVFAQKDLRVLSEQIVGKNKNVAKFTVEDDGGRRLDMVYFGDIETLNRFLEQKYGKDRLDGLRRGIGEPVTISAAYYPALNEYRGSASIQLVLQDYC